MNKQQAESGYETFNLTIPEFRAKDALAKIKRLSRKAEELGMPAFSIEIGETRVGKRTINGRTHNLAVVPIQVVGGPPKISGWRFIAKIDHDDMNEVQGFAAQRLVDEEPELFKWLTQCEPNCEHCNFKRNRNTTFLFQSDKDPATRIQVGSSCVDDFAGHDSPIKILGQANQFAAVIDELTDEDGLWDGGGGSGYALYDVEQVLTVAAAVVREDGGWVSRDKAGPSGSTVDWVTQVMFDPKTQRKIIEDGDKVQAKKIYEWLTSDAFEVGTDLYRHNLRMMATQGYVKAKAIGFMGSAVATYAREQQVAERRRQERAKQVSMTLGKEGEKLNLEVRVDRIIPIETMYGVSRLHIMRCLETGAKLTWFNSGSGKFMEGDQYQITGRVKRHSERDGIKETQMSRVNSPDLALHKKIHPEMDEKAIIKKASKLQNINARDRDGENLLHVASHYYCYRQAGKEIILSLLEQGADPSLVSTRDGNCAFDYWVDSRDAELIELGVKNYPELTKKWTDKMLEAYQQEGDTWVPAFKAARDRFLVEQERLDAESAAQSDQSASDAPPEPNPQRERGGAMIEDEPEFEEDDSLRLA